MGKKQIEQTEIEAPYELPEGWKWVPLLEAFENKTSSQKKIPTNEYLENGKYAIVDQGQDFIGGYTNDETKVFDEDLPVIIFGDHTKCIKYIDFPFAQGADGVKVLKSKKEIDSKFLYYGLKSIPFPDLGYRRHFPMFKNFSFPLPPTLEEQQRIVNRIEILFAKLDQAKEKAQNVVDTVETRKASILHKAFTGELTKKWREENGVGDDSWEEKKLEDVCNSIYDGDHMPPPKSDYGIHFLVISNVNNGFLSFENTRFVSEEYYQSLSETRKPKKGDVLYTLVGSYGIPVVVNTDKPFCFQRHMALLKLKTIDTYFLWYLLQTKSFYDKASEIATGTAQLTVPIKGLRNIPILVPDSAEQIEIVRILDVILEKEIKAKEAAEAVLEQIELLKKSILARAFRGEL